MWAHQDKEGSTALMLAAKKGLTSVVHKLLELGAKAELIDQVPRNDLYVCTYVYTLVCIHIHKLSHLYQSSYKQSNVAKTQGGEDQ